MVEILCVVTGKVQGVRYRDFVQVSATTLGVVGYVKNAEDGTVLVCGQGMPDTLREFVEYLHEGSLQAHVDSVSVDWQTPKVTFTDFSIYH